MVRVRSTVPDRHTTSRPWLSFRARIVRRLTLDLRAFSVIPSCDAASGSRSHWSGGSVMVRCRGTVLVRRWYGECALWSEPPLTEARAPVNAGVSLVAPERPDVALATRCRTCLPIPAPCWPPPCRHAGPLRLTRANPCANIYAQQGAEMPTIETSRNKVVRRLEGEGWLLMRNGAEHDI